MSTPHPALGPQFPKQKTPTERFKDEMDYRYDEDPDRLTDERYEKRRDQ